MKHQCTDTPRYERLKHLHPGGFLPRTVKMLRNLVFPRNLNLHVHCELVPMAAEHLDVDLDQAIGSGFSVH